MKENKEPIFQLSANLRISYLHPDLFSGSLETKCRLSNILFHMFRDKPIFFFSRTPPFRTLAYGHYISPEGVRNNRSGL